MAKGPSLPEAPDLFRQLFANSNDAQYVIDFDSNIILEANPALERLTGYTRAQIIGRIKGLDLIAPMDRPDQEKRRAQRLEKPSERYDLRIIRKDKTLCHVSCSVRLVEIGGRRLTLGSLQDLSARQEAAQTNRQSQVRLRLMADQLPGILWTVDRHLVFTQSIGSALKGLGLRPNEVVGQTLFQFFQTDDPKNPVIIAHRNALEGRSVSFTTDWGGRRYESHVEPLHDTQGQIIGVAGVALDVTEPNRTREALRTSEELLQTVVSGAPVILFALDKEGIFTMVVGKGLDTLDMRPDQLVGKSLFEVYRDIPNIRNRFRDALGGFNTMDTIEFDDLVFESRHSPLRDASGNVSGLIGVATDVTEQRRAVKELRDNEAKYAYLFQHANDCVFLHDLEGKLIDVNKQVLDTFGYTKSELLSLRLPDLHPSEALEQSLSMLDKVNREGRAVFETMFMKKNGEEFTAEVSASLLDVGGRRVVQGVVRDMTERRRLEEANRTRIQEIIKANARIGILKEKLEHVQALAATLFNLREEDKVLEAAARFMRAREKLGYADVVFYLMRDGKLTPALGRGRADPEVTFGSLVVGDESIRSEGAHLAAPLKGIDENIGVMEITLPPKELETLKESPTAHRSYMNIVSTLSNILGLSIENIRLYKQVFKDSIVDALTQIYNRRYLDTKLEEELRRARRYERPLSILLMDINSFKLVNDRHEHGHRQGDVLLKELAQVLTRSTREVDIVARYGGDEFVVIMPETQRRAAEKKAELVAQVVRDTGYTDLSTGGKDLRMTISVGVASLEADTRRTAGDLIREADQAMYAAKQRHKSGG